MSEPASAVTAAASPDQLWNDWDVPPRVPSTPELHLDGFDGPIDLLLDLVERRRIDLRRISPRALVEQFVDAMDLLSDRVAIERRADWLLMAIRLVLLRSRLCFPVSIQDKAKAEREAQHEHSRLEGLAFVRAVAAWLEAQPQLGRDFFVRPAGPSHRVSSYMDLMEGCLAVLQFEEDRATALEQRDVVLRISATTPFSVQATLQAMRARLALMAGPETLASFAPAIPRDTEDVAFAARCATSSVFVAALEVARTGEASISQGGCWTSVILCPVEVGTVRNVPIDAVAD